MNTNFNNVLKNSENIDIPTLKKSFSITDIKKNIVDIIKSDEELNQAKTNEKFRQNLLELISYLLFIEQNNFQIEKGRTSLKSKIFDDESLERINIIL